MDSNVTIPNNGFVNLILNSSQVLPVDANFLIPPDRSIENRQVPPITFGFFKEFWLDPILSLFPSLSLHEAIYRELISPLVKSFVDLHKNDVPPKIKILTDSLFTPYQEIYRKTIEQRIAHHTSYDPILDNADDRGEVKSLAHIATSELIYFCSHDSNALRLIEKAPELETNLDSVYAIKTYEIIYFLYRVGAVNPQKLKGLYKYLYYLTNNEKRSNPNWGQFTQEMDGHYIHLFQKVNS